MSKRDLKKYLSGLSKEHLEEQILDLYGRFKNVKEFYDFAFNPKEEKLMEQARFLISKEYFPVNRRRPKTRRSVAQKLVRHYKQLGVEPALIADLMLYNLEIAQAYSSERIIKSDAFYKSMLKSFEEAVHYVTENGLVAEYKQRIVHVADEAGRQQWFNRLAFDDLVSSPVFDKLPKKH